MHKKTIKNIALWFSIGFFLIVGLNWLPWIHDSEGYMFGLFHLDLIDDIVHLVSAVWALSAVLISYRACVLYFKIFGTFYFTDALICFVAGQCLADGTIVTHGHHAELLSMANFTERFFLNAPHFAIGAVALYAGFYLSKKIVSAKK